MDRNELMKHLQDYGNTINNRAATVNHYTDIKNKIRAAYDAGNIDKELMKQLSDKASGVFKNMGRTQELTDLPSKIIEKGGRVGGLEGIKNSLGNIAGETSEIAPKFKNLGKMLAFAGPAALAAGAFGIGNKAMAGDIPGAAGDAVNMATDYIPGIGEAKLALNPTDVGAGSDLVDKPLMAQSPKNNSAYSGDELARNLKFPDLNKLTSAPQANSDLKVNDSMPDTSNMKHFQNQEMPEQDSEEPARFKDLSKLLGKVRLQQAN